ncbi:MAG: universal stress protein [Bacteroidetes bacterium]|nr:universal stress protein [Bacteroidota bacterium]
MPALVTLATYEQPKTAYFLKEKLEKENIDCFFAITGSTVEKWDKVRVQVKEEDVEKAIKVMLRIKEEHDMDIDQISPAGLFRRIIVPTDFSEGSEYACHYAIHLAQKIKAEIKLLHVYKNPAADLGIKESATYLDYIKNTIHDAEKKAKNEIVAFTNKMKAYMGAQKIKDVKIHSSIVMGNIVEKIKGISQTYKTDLIVLGTVGGSGDSKSIFAGLADAIISGLEIPLYAIPGPCSAKDFENMDILYATDFNEKDHKSLERLLNIVEPLDKKITCIHIDTAHNPAKNERLDELNEQLQKEYSQHNIQCLLIEDEDIFHGIKDFADSYQVNLLSFTVHKRGIFEKLFKPNLFRKILKESNLPILLFPS